MPGCRLIPNSSSGTAELNPGKVRRRESVVAVSWVALEERGLQCVLTESEGTESKWEPSDQMSMEITANNTSLGQLAVSVGACDS